MNDRTRNCVWKWSLIGLFGVAALALPAGGYWLYRHADTSHPKRETERAENHRRAEGQSDRRVAKERVSDARVHSRRDCFAPPLADG